MKKNDKKEELKKDAVKGEIPAGPKSEKAAKAVVKHLRIGPRKMRLVLDVIRYKPVPQAFRALMILKKKAARMVEKALKTAAANAKVLGMDENKLYVAKVWADGGPVMKRFMARSMGRADRMLKRSTHLTVIVKESDRSFGDGATASAGQGLEVKSKKEKISSKTAKAGSKAKAAAAASV